MATKIFVNFPVKDLTQSIKFFTKLGFVLNPQFSDETAACMMVSEEIYTMLLTHDRFKEFTHKKLSDTTQSSEVIISISADSKAQVNSLVETALTVGGSEVREPKDYGFMFDRSFNDLDGHTWEIFWMDENAVPHS